MDCSMPGFPVLHHLPELVKTHGYWVSDAIQPSNPLSFPSSPAFSLCQHQSLPMSQPFVSGGQSVEASASASVLPVNIQDWFPLGLTGLNSLLSKEVSSLLQHQSSRASILRSWAFFLVQLSHLCMTTGKTITLTIQIFVGKVISLLFNTVSRFVIPPRSKHLLISWLKLLSTVILEPPKIKSVSAFHFPLFYLPWRIPWS